MFVRRRSAWVLHDDIYVDLDDKFMHLCETHMSLHRLIGQLIELIYIYTNISIYIFVQIFAMYLFIFFA